jgi:hypothetical protein
VVRELTPRVRHVHARVGFEEGPQVPDPRGPRWAPYLEGYKAWWAAIYDAAAARGDAVVSTTPEFGPPMYAWTDPFTDKPLASMWDVNHYVGQQVAALYARKFGAEAAAKMVPDEAGADGAGGAGAAASH